MVGLTFFKANGDKCPFCLGNNLNNFTTKQFDLEKKGELISIIECTDCCFAWQWPINSTKYDSIAFFEAEYRRKEKGSYFDPQKKLAVSSLQFEFIQNIAHKKNIDLLDVGAGDGTFIKIAAEHGWNALGIEPTECNFTFNNKKAKGFAEMICGYISSIPQNREFDVITMWDVIEHVEEPIDLIKSALEFLKQDGMLIIETGNYQSADRIASQKWWWCYHPDHRWYFSPPILKHILIELGLENVAFCSRTLRPWWNPEANYIRPSISRVIKSIIKNPFNNFAQIEVHYELKKAWKEWPQWAKNSIITIAGSRNQMFYETDSWYVIS